jgi:hypothetical protein
MKKIPMTIIFVIIVFVGGFGITLAYEVVFDALDIPYNQNLADARIKRITEPLTWIEERISNLLK